MGNVERTVHIVPMGWEHDRVVRPLRDAKAYKAHLVTRKDDQKNHHFLEKVKTSLESKNIETNDEEVDPEREFESNLMHVSRLIRNEYRDGNRVFVHLGAGSKIAASAATIAAAFRSDRVGKLYYASPEEYIAPDGDVDVFREHGLSKGYENTQNLPLFEMKKPNEAGTQMLVGLYEDEPKTLIECIQYLFEEGVSSFHDAGDVEKPDPQDSEQRRENNKFKQRFRRRVLDELLDLDLVDKKREGLGQKVRLSLAPDGEVYALATGQIAELR